MHRLRDHTDQRFSKSFHKATCVTGALWAQAGRPAPPASKVSPPLTRTRTSTPTGLKLPSSAHLSFGLGASSLAQVDDDERAHLSRRRQTSLARQISVPSPSSSGGPIRIGAQVNDVSGERRRLFARDDVGDDIIAGADRARTNWTLFGDESRDLSSAGFGDDDEKCT